LSEPYAKKPKKEPFTKLDFSAVVLHHRLLTPNAVLEHMFEKGSKAMQLWVHCRQRKLKEFIQDALDMEAAKPAAALEKESDWSLVERLCQCMYIWAAFSRRAKTAKKRVNLLLLKEPRLQKKVSIYYAQTRFKNVWADKQKGRKKTPGRSTFQISRRRSKNIF